MRWEDLKASLSDFWFEFRREKSGLVGMGLLILFIAMAVFAPFIADPETSRHWRDVTYWQDLPRSVPPTWVNAFSRTKLAPHEILRQYDRSERTIGNIKEISFTFSYNYDYDRPPTDMMLILDINSTNPTKPPTIVVSVERPDGAKIDLVSSKLSGAATAEERHLRILVTAFSSTKANVVAFARQYESPENLQLVHYELLDPLIPLFAKAQPGMMVEDKAEPLRGVFTIKVVFYTFNPEDRVNDVSIIMAGRTYGLLGTDALRRDLFAGLVWGTRVSLVVGIVSSVLTTMVGVLYGVASAYFGGWADEILQRIAEIVASIPVLPLLIIIFAFYKPSIWPVIVLMALMSWPGTNKVVRSMGLQLKEMPYVEAARALGAGGRWIIVRHMMPQILPYVFASIALGVPGYVLLEAGLSFLGLGDVTRVTWGQILHDAQGAAATIKGMWWWVVPPGLAIALMGLSFALLGSALNKILSPKMRTL